MKSKFTMVPGATLGLALALCFSSLTQAQEATPDAVAAAPASHMPPTNWNDTFLGFRYGTDFRYPGVPDPVAQRIGYLTTTGGFKYGSYVFNVDYLISNSANPQAGPAGSTGGAQEIYSVGRVTFSAGKILGHPVAFGFVRDVGLTTGYEFGTKNDAYAESSRMLVLGPSLEFAVPRGFWNLTAGVRTESNHNGISNVDVHFDPALHIESSWMFPFNAASVPLVLRGFVSVTGAKGKDGFGLQTTTEFLTRVALLVDLGSYIGQPHAIYAGIGYEYWHNMYGTPASSTARFAPGSTQTSTPMLMAEVHF